jgi:HK97 family phage portal protein
MGWGLSSWWRKPALKVRDPENSSARRSDTWAGRAVGPEGAMQLSAFWACVRLISETVATLPVGVFQRERDGSKTPRSDHSLYEILHDSPNADQTAAEFWEGVILSICVHGDGFALKEESGARLVALTPLPADPAEMDVRRIEDGSIRYRFVDRGKREDLPEDKVFHVRGFGSRGLRGLSPLAYARQSLALNEAISASAGSTFKNGMKSSVFFTGPAGVKLTNETRADFKKTFIDPFVGADATAAAGLLEHGFDVKTVSMSPADAEMLLSWKFSTEEICRFLRVPPILIGHSAEGQTMWGTGVGQILAGWRVLGLAPYLTRSQQASRKRLLSAADRSKGIFVEWNPDGLLWADPTGRADQYSKLLQSAAMTPNQICDKENLPRFEGGDVRLINSTLIPVEMAGQRTARVQPAAGDPIPE